MLGALLREGQCVARRLTGHCGACRLRGSQCVDAEDGSHQVFPAVLCGRTHGVAWREASGGFCRPPSEVAKAASSSHVTSVSRETFARLQVQWDGDGNWAIELREWHTAAGAAVDGPRRGSLCHRLSAAARAKPGAPTPGATGAGRGAGRG